MRVFRIAWTRPVAALMLAASAALAAPDAPTAAGNPAGPAPVPGDVQANLSPAEMLAQAKADVEKMQDALRSVVQLQTMTTKQKDIIKLNCTNDKVTQVKGHLAVANNAIANLTEAVAKNDADNTTLEYTRVTILYQKVLVLRTEAENCVGEDMSYVGATNVTVDIDPAIPVGDVTAFDVPAIDTTRPPAASSSL